MSSMEKPANKHRWRCCGWLLRLVVFGAVASFLFTLSARPAQAVQYGRPDGDISTSTWTTTPLWDKLDETSSDGATTSTDHVVRYAINSNKSTCSGTAYLIQGTTTIASKTISSWPTTYTTDSFTLTSGEADSITNYTDLRFRLNANCTAGGNTQASWVELEVPSAANTGQSVTITITAVRHLE